MIDPADVPTYQEQAASYLVTRYGPDILGEDPESLQNILERWIMALAADNPVKAAEYMLIITEGLRSRYGGLETDRRQADLLWERLDDRASRDRGQVRGLPRAQVPPDGHG